jgi:putative ubiquitin-RnfH superfamily antitoxin RatB of RatAB toxin-antitoxin module
MAGANPTDVAATIRVEVAYARPDRQAIIPVDVPAGATLEQAIIQSHIQEQFPEIQVSAAKVGVFGKLSKLSATVRAGDRVEIYRPLLSRSQGRCASSAPPRAKRCARAAAIWSRRAVSHAPSKRASVSPLKNRVNTALFSDLCRPDRTDSNNPTGFGERDQRPTASPSGVAPVVGSCRVAIERPLLWSM